MIDVSTIKNTIIQFNIGLVTFIKLTTLKVFIKLIKFYIICADIPFLLSLVNINKFKIYYTNIKNIIAIKFFFFGYL